MRVIRLLFVSAIVVSLASCSGNGDFKAKSSLDSEIDSMSYTLGLDMGFKLRANLSEVDRNLYIKGLVNGLDSVDMMIDSKEISNVIQAYVMKKQQEDMMKAQQAQAEKAEAEFGEVKKEGVQFLADNKSKEGVITTESGLQYIVLKEGSDKKPLATSTVKVHYHGTLTDGTVFDSSVDRSTPSQFAANRVIKGWTEGLQLMGVGAKYKFFIPQELGYGASPRPGGKIRPFEALVFEVELLEIIK